MSFRVSLIKQAAVNRGSRTIVRDPRKNVPKSSPKGMNHQIVVQSQSSQKQISPTLSSPPQPFAPSQENQQSVGSALVSYALAGAGMTLGFVLVGAIFGVP
jgi:hypothetical protein